MEYWCSGPISMFLQKQLVSFVFVAITYFLINRLSTGLVSFLCQPLKRMRQFRRIWEKPVTTGYKSTREKMAVQHYNAGVSHLQKGMPEKGIREIEAALAIEPRFLNGQPWVILAEHYFEQQNFKKAYSLLEKALDWFPSLKTCYRVALLYRRYGEREKARALFRATVADYKVQLKFRKKAEWRWAVFAFIRSFQP